jgi:SAM-dependent methyltransferase
VSDRAAQARSFETVAADYERHRPEYPEKALRWAAGLVGLDGRARVLDVGAGTGKLARGLVALGYEVVAVEPGGPMLDELRQAVPQAEALEGSAEAIALPDGDVDAAFAAQAFHWFDRERAVPELHRVVRPRGGLALLWNWWDDRDPLQHELAELIGFAGHSPFVDEELPGAPWFRELGRTVVESADDSSPDALVAMLATTSRFLTADPAERADWLREVGERASRYGEQFPLPKLTYAFAFERLS